MRSILLCLTLSPSVVAQAPPPPPVPPAPPVTPSWIASSPEGAPKTFEVASVKVNKSERSWGGWIRPSAGNLTVSNMTLESLVSWAYGVRDYQMVGVAGWFRSEKYDIAAKAYRAPDASHLKLLLQALLADRFKLVVHRETRDVAMYLLVIDAKGSKLKASTGVASPGQPRLTGGTSDLSSFVTGQHATMLDLVNNLSIRIGRPVADRTGLKGKFDFQLEWKPDENQLSRMPVYMASTRADEPGGVTLFNAVKEQLGLKLEAQKGPGEVLVIDRVARVPTDN
jgi:uncharacterized protein (TIGR03435 family)